MNEDVVIQVREDGSRAVVSSLNQVADASDKVGGSQDAMQKILSQVNATLIRLDSSIQKLNFTLSSQATATQRVVQAQAQATASTEALTRATEQQAETDAQAQARIHAMITASMERANAQAAAATAARQQAAAQAQATQGAAAASDAAAAADRRLVQAQTASMQAYTNARAPVTALQAILEKSKLTTAEVAKAEALLDTAQKSGIVTSGELKEAFALLDAAKIKDIAVTKAQTAANKENSLLNARAQGEIATAGTEILSGNFGRLRRTGASLLNQTGLLRAAMTPLGIAILGVGTAVGTLATAFVKGEEESSKFAKALISVGGYAGVTNIQLHDMAESISGTTIGKAKDALLQLASSGKFMGDQLHLAAQAAVDMSNVTGKSLEESVKAITDLRGDPVNAIQKLNEQFHFLDLATFQQIQRLQELGQTQQAADLAEQTYASNMRQRAQEVQESLGTLQRWWNDVKSAASSAWDAMMGIGRKPAGALAQLQQDYDALLQRKKALDDVAGGGAGFDTLIDFIKNPDLATKSFGAMRSESENLSTALENARQEMAKLQSQANDKAVAKQMQADGIAAAAMTEQWSKGYDKVADRAAAAAKVTEALSKIVSANGALPEGVQQIGDKFFGKGFDYMVDKVAGIGKERAPKDKSAQELKKYQQDLQALKDTIDPAQAAMNKLTAAQDLLQKAVARGDMSQKDADFDLSLYQAQLQDSINPLEALRNKLDQQIESLKNTGKATDAQNKARNDANNLLKQGIVLSDADVQGLADQYAAIDKLTEKQRVYNRIQKSIIDQTKTYVDEMEVLNKMLSSGSITQNQADKYLVQQNPDLFKGTQKQLQVQIQGYKDYYSQIEAMRKANVISAQDASVMEMNVDQQIMNARLGQTESFLGTLANMKGSHSKKAAGIAKAAAIAETIIETYKSATGAFSALASIPYVGPFLGAAAAAAAVAAGMANIQQIRATNYQGGYRTGGEFLVGGNGGADSQRISFDASPGERVTIHTPEQARALARADSILARGARGTNVTQNLTIAVAGKMDRRTQTQIARENRRAVRKEYERSNG